MTNYLGRWQYFANGDLDGSQTDITADNPHKEGINTSDKVGEFIERPGSEIFAGIYTIELPSTIVLPNDDKRVRMKVWMDNPGTVVFKLERSTNGAPNTGDLKVEYTKSGEWEELEWDLSSIVPDDAIYTLISIIPDFDETPDAEKRYYIDDLAIGAATCGSPSTSARELTVESLQVYPNPATGELHIENGNELYRYDIFSTTGQKMFSVQTNGQRDVRVDLTSLHQGMYILTGYDRYGLLKANARFVKQ